MYLELFTIFAVLLACISNQNKRSAVKKTSSETLKSIFLAEVAFLFPQKGNGVFLLREKKKKLSVVFMGDGSCS